MTNYLRAFYYLQGMMRSAYWSSDKLKAHQDKKLRSLLAYAFDNVSFYHEKFRRSGLKPSDISTVEDLKKLPITTKDEIRQNAEAMVSNEFQEHSLREISTSGSTGKPLFLRISTAEDEFRKAKHLRANVSCGQKPWDSWVVITSPRHFGVTTRFQRMLGIYTPRSVSVFNDIDKQLSIVESLKPDVLDGYSSSLLLLAKEAEKRGSKSIRPKFIVGGAELVDQASCQYVERIFDAPFYDQYSSVEFERMAWQCPEKTGYHMDAESIVFQFADENGEDVSPGEAGEIICTSLFNYAMPLIRYRIGDVGVRSDDECPCGRTLPLMKMMEGRRDSLLVFPDGKTLSPRTLTVAVSLSKLYGQIDQFRILQKRIDCFEIQIKPRKDQFDKDSFKQELSEHVRRTIGSGADSVDFEVKFVPSIPLDKSGKLMIVVSELHRQHD